MCDAINFYEIKPSPRKRRKVSMDENTFMNPALDLLNSEDPICNNTMEVKKANRKRKRSKSVDVASTFENCALDLGNNRQALSSALSKELHNVKRLLQPIPEVSPYRNTSTGSLQNVCEPIYANISHSYESTKDKLGISNLSFIDKLDINDSNHSLCIDDDLNESNIMEIKTLADDGSVPLHMFNSTNPFLFDMLKEKLASQFKTETVYNADSAETSQEETVLKPVATVIPRRLFINDTNSTISTVNDSINENHEYATIEELNNEPCYENIPQTYNKQSKILGHDVSKLTSLDILNLCNSGCLNSAHIPNTFNSSNDSDRSKVKDMKSHVLNVSNKLSKKVLKKFKQMYKHEKPEMSNTLNPYEVQRKPVKEKVKTYAKANACFENPGLKIDISDESVTDEDEPTYETIKTAKNTMYNMTITPLKERNIDDYQQTSNASGSKKQVRFNATLNKEKVITGNSFDLNQTDIDLEIEDFSNELENCINEKKIIALNM